MGGCAGSSVTPIREATFFVLFSRSSSTYSFPAFSLGQASEDFVHERNEEGDIRISLIVQTQVEFIM